MSLEWVLLTFVTLTTVVAVFFGDEGSLKNVFKRGGRGLGGRLERQIEVGSGFRVLSDNSASRYTVGVGWADKREMGKSKPVQ